MSNYNFEVDTTKLKNSAKKIEGYNTQYEQSYEKMYGEVESLSINWKGTSSDTFNQALNEARDNYIKLNDALKEYVENLRIIAGNYESTETNITANANNLCNR